MSIAALPVVTNALELVQCMVDDGVYGVMVTVKPFAGNWVDIGPGADDGQVTWCRADWALIAPRG